MGRTRTRGLATYWKTSRSEERAGNRSKRKQYEKNESMGDFT
jgi:hypothetical protein